MHRVFYRIMGVYQKVLGGIVMENLYYLVPAAGVIGLIVAGVFAVKVKKAGTGTERMREVSQAIQEGASAFLRAEYRVLIVFVA